MVRRELGSPLIGFCYDCYYEYCDDIGIITTGIIIIIVVATITIIIIICIILWLSLSLSPEFTSSTETF